MTFTCRDLLEKVEFVMQFTGDGGNGDYYDSHKRIKFRNLPSGKIRMSANTSNIGGHWDFESGLHIDDFEIKAQDLYDFLKPIKKDPDLKFEKDGNLLVIKAGRARKKFDIFCENNDLVKNIQTPDEWYELPDGFYEDMRLTSKIKSETFAWSQGYLLSFQTGVTLLAIEKPMIVPEFQVLKSYIGKILSFEPTKIALTKNCVFFANENQQIHTTLFVSAIKKISALLDSIKNVPRTTTMLFKKDELKEAYGVLKTGKSVENNLLRVTLYPKQDGIELSAGDGKQVVYMATDINTSPDKQIDKVQLPIDFFHHVFDLGMMEDDVVTLRFPEKSNVCCVENGNARYICAVFSDSV